MKIWLAVAVMLVGMSANTALAQYAHPDPEVPNCPILHDPDVPIPLRNLLAAFMCPGIFLEAGGSSVGGGAPQRVSSGHLHHHKKKVALGGSAGGGIGGARHRTEQ